MPDYQLILASGSPRRRELLSAAGYGFEILPPDASAEDEIRPGEAPAEYVARVARQKVEDVAAKITGQHRAPYSVIVGCDTVAECDGEILGKPRDREHARQMLQFLSSREHRVLSGLCLWPLDGRAPIVEVDTTVLVMDRLSPEQIEAYLATRQWEGKAGAFGYQDGIDWVHVIQGSESNVVGLPMELLAKMLKRL